MLNQVIVVGRIQQINKTEERNEVVISTPRAYKNVDGIYENDIITAKLHNGMIENVANYLKTGDLIGIKGRIQSTQQDDKTIMEVVAEKVTFLSSKSEQIKKEMEN